LTLLGAFVGVASVYRIATGSNGRGLAVVPGAIVAVVGFAGVSAAFSLYVARLARYAAFYGALASVTVLLIWLWLSSLALLVGAEVNALVSRRRSERG
jgi:membrane protein